MQSSCLKKKTLTLIQIFTNMQYFLPSMVLFGWWFVELSWNRPLLLPLLPCASCDAAQSIVCVWTVWEQDVDSGGLVLPKQTLLLCQWPRTLLESGSRLCNARLSYYIEACELCVCAPVLSPVLIKLCEQQIEKKWIESCQSCPLAWIMFFPPTLCPNATSQARIQVDVTCCGPAVQKQQCRFLSNWLHWICQFSAALQPLTRREKYSCELHVLIPGDRIE